MFHISKSYSNLNPHPLMDNILLISPSMAPLLSLFPPQCPLCLPYFSLSVPFAFSISLLMSPLLSLPPPHPLNVPFAFAFPISLSMAPLFSQFLSQCLLFFHYFPINGPFPFPILSQCPLCFHYFSLNVPFAFHNLMDSPCLT